MTLQDLNAYLSKCRQLEAARESLLDLEEAAVPGAKVLTGMPRAPGVRDRVGSIAIAIADTKDAIAELEREVEATKKEIEALIQTIPAVDLRTLFRLRFLQLLSWEDIAEIFRWRYDEATLRRRVERYMKKNYPENHKNEEENENEKL